MIADKCTLRRLVRIAGVVQGVGFRPFVYNLAHRANLRGWVRNTSGSVEIDVEGPADLIEDFIGALRTEAPPLARVESVTHIDADPAGWPDFRILESESSDCASSVIPADVGTCPKCFEETLTPTDRRFGYPFTNCTDCGPRFTIIHRVPYDRPNTTMSLFEMCDECASEYRNPSDRRFHAEPIACPKCGPNVWLEQNGGRVPGKPLTITGRLLWEGHVVAIKGLGGFHLACDARNEEAVREIRIRKGRVCKPFAVMVRDVDEAGRVCRLDAGARELLESRRRPIVIAIKAGAGIAESVAPGNSSFGIMLPYTPLQELLFEHCPPALVMTSGNLGEEPLAFTNSSAKQKLGNLADAFLMHDRDIHVPCDDSVIRALPDGDAIVIRRARGYVPESIELPIDCGCVLGVGAEQKNTFCLAWGRTAVVSQHIGDLNTAEAFDYYTYAAEHFGSLFRCEPEIVAHDMHPEYLSTKYALAKGGVTLQAVQHHHAHIASCLAENGRASRCIGLALDGTGYGTDGTVWGGEILTADLADFERAGRFAQVRMPGGEAAIRDPRRMAAAFLHEAYGPDFERVSRSIDIDFPAFEQELIRRQLTTGLHSPLTSSAGRLFDAVSAAVGICRDRTYEGQPAVELEAIADESELGTYSAPLIEQDGLLVLDTISVFRAAVEDRLNGTAPSVIAARFQNSMADLLAQACVTIRDRTGLNAVALSGGVFQNAFVFTKTRARLERMGFEVLSHRLLPPNDGGISLGQVAVAAARAARARVK